MAKIEIPFHRRLRITSKPDAIGISVLIQDADTGEMIENICRAVLVISAAGINTIRLFYVESDSETKVIEKEIDVPIDEVDMFAYEIGRETHDKDQPTEDDPKASH